MKSIIIFFLLFVLALPVDSFCQQPESSPGKLIGISLGANDFHMKDEYLSPIIFNGFSFSSQVSYDVNTPGARQNAELFFSLGSLNSDKQPRDVTQYAGTLSYNYSIPVSDADILGKPFYIYAGAGISSFFAFTTFDITDVYHDESFYWTNNLNLVVTSGCSIGNEKVLFQLSLPVVRFYSRPVHGHSMVESNNWPDVTSNFPDRLDYIWRNPMFTGRIEYRSHVINSLYFRGIYSFTYASSDQPETINMGLYMNNLLIGFMWGL